MILKALYDYYKRCVEKDPNSLPPYGFDTAEIAYSIVITSDGEFRRLAPCAKTDDGSHYVPIWAPRGFDRTSDKTAQVLWDKTNYVLGYINGEIKENSVELLNFIQVVNNLVISFPKNKTFKAVHEFYKNKEYLNVIKDEDDKTNIEKASVDKLFLTFSILGEDDVVASYMNISVRDDLLAYAEMLEEKMERGTCLVTGNQDCPIVRKTGITPLLSATSGKLVAFQANRGYDSYGFSQGLNAPISARVEHAIYIALKELLSRNIDSNENDNRIDVTIYPHKSKTISGRMIKVGEKQRAYIFWLSNPIHEIEECITSLLVPRKTEANIKEALLSFKARPQDSDEIIKFYLLGLSPNGKARIAVNFWAEMELSEVVNNFIQFYDDIRVESTCDVAYNIVSIIQSTTKPIKDKKTNKFVFAFRPNISEYVVKAILFNQQLPVTLFHDCIQRYKKEQRPTLNDELSIFEFEKRECIRAGILRSYLNKDIEKINNNNQIITTMLNKEDKNPGYLCGRLFALLEWIQGAANEVQKLSIHEDDFPKEYRTNIRARYIDSASSAPSSVFPTLIRLSSHHSDILKSKKQYDYEMKKEEIINNFEKGCFPDQLDIKQQGRFFIGYYQQRQNLYARGEMNNNNN